jgi:hypothetical protein
MVGLVGRSGFEKQVKIHNTERGAKGLKSWTHFVSMLFGQVSSQHGLRSIEQGMNNQRHNWYHLGIHNTERQIKRSTLSYANNHRASDLYEGLFEQVLNETGKIQSGHGFRFKNPLYSVDSTTIDLCLKLFPWADFRKKKAGIKLTVKLDHQGKIPCFIVVSNAREHDSKKIGEVPLEKNDVVIFDRGYTNYEYFKRLCEEKVWFVTRLKRNAVYTYLKKRPVKEGGNTISDYEIRLSGMGGGQRLRKILIRDPETKKKITLLTNNLTWSSRTIGEIYKARWQIELFSRR